MGHTGSLIGGTTLESPVGVLSDMWRGWLTCTVLGVISSISSSCRVQLAKRSTYPYRSHVETSL